MPPYNPYQPPASSDAARPTPVGKEAIDPSQELVYAPLDDGAGRDGSLTLFRHVSMPIFFATVGAWIVGPIGGLVALLGAAAWSVWSWRTRRSVGGAVLRVHGGALTVDIRGPRGLFERFRLDDLANVSLDIKTVERVIEGTGVVPAARFIDSKVAPSQDTARVVLVSAGGREVPLTDAYLPHFEAIASLGKIRAFLRKNGWIPEDEREDPAGG